jgi:CRISPR-associated protein Csm3
MSSTTEVQLKGKVICRFEIRAETGLRIGGSSEGIKIGGVDAKVIRDARDRPYIPGSSLKGKLRSLHERRENAALNDRDGTAHRCRTPDAYARCAVCRIWGTMPESGTRFDVATLTRIAVRDCYLDVDSFKQELPGGEPTLSEVKTEIAIDRRTGTTPPKGAGGLRQVERVPAGARFRPAEFVFNVFEESDKGLLKCVFEAMSLLEDDYLGGMGSRGYGKVKFENMRVWWNAAGDYSSGDVDVQKKSPVNGEHTTPGLLVRGFEELKARLA